MIEFLMIYKFITNTNWESWKYFLSAVLGTIQNGSNVC